jgi:hypothetical protein
MHKTYLQKNSSIVIYISGNFPKHFEKRHLQRAPEEFFVKVYKCSATLCRKHRQLQSILILLSFTKSNNRRRLDAGMQCRNFITGISVRLLKVGLIVLLRNSISFFNLSRSEILNMLRQAEFPHSNLFFNSA